MSPIRLFSPVALEAASQLELGDDQAHYLVRSLRLRPGDTFTMFDGSGGEYPATIIAASKNGVTVETGMLLQRECESPLQIHLVQGVSRGDRMDVVVQKACELGVHRITPVTSDYSVVKLDAKRAARRHEHWTRIAQSACEQCGRNRVPRIDEARSLLDWFASGAAAGGFVLAPGAPLALAAVDCSDARALLLIGPEGGLSEAEYARAAAANMLSVALGPRILRTETAAIAAISVLQTVNGDFGTPGIF